MKVAFIKPVIFLLGCLIYTTGFSQKTKQEKESAIKIEAFPGDIPAEFHKIHSDFKREKFYKQKDGVEISFEMKFRHMRYDYSVEVDTIGRLIDIEIKVKKSKMPSQLVKEIEDHFDKNFDRFKIEKIQSQFKNNKEQLPQKLMKKVIDQPLATPDYYEIIVAVKEDGDFKRFEFLFNTNGKVEKKRKVLRNEFDYLIF